MTASPALDPEPGALGSLVRKGLSWSFLNTIIGRAGTVLVGIVLARLLSPEDYGVFAVALVALNALLAMNELGVSLAIVRWPGELERIAPTVTTLALAGSVGLYGLCFVAAPWLATAMGAPEATGVLRLLCAGVVIDGATAVPAALLTRTFRQGRRMVADFTSFGISTVLSIWLAVAGYGAWSLAWGRLAGNGVAAVLFVLLAPARFRPGFDAAQARRLLAFGLPLAGSSLLVFAMLNVDYVVVGSLLGPVALGFYLLAFNLSSWPVNVFSVAVRRVSLAGFSRLVEDPGRLRSSFARSLGLLMTATLPVCVLLGLMADPLVRFVYGDRWAPAAGALRWLALLSAARVAAELAYDLLVAVGRSRSTLWLQGAWTLALIPVLALGARLAGISGVAAGHAAVALLLVVPAFAVSLARVGIGPRALGAELTRPLLGSIVVAACCLVALALPSGPFLQLAVAGASGLGAYAALVVFPLRRNRTSLPQL
ncbi:MAG TPA: lipopolysaccharide biosynthesis protein [Actinomycetes bacterium]|nr:lipopolysaccharide biosynthesis protein [Actinomycetes bacterium]